MEYIIKRNDVIEHETIANPDYLNILKFITEINNEGLLRASDFDALNQIIKLREDGVYSTWSNYDAPLEQIRQPLDMSDRTKLNQSRLIERIKDYILTNASELSEDKAKLLEDFITYAEIETNICGNNYAVNVIAVYLKNLYPTLKITKRNGVIEESPLARSTSGRTIPLLGAHNTSLCEQSWGHGVSKDSVDLNNGERSADAFKKLVFYRGNEARAMRMIHYHSDKLSYEQKLFLLNQSLKSNRDSMEFIKVIASNFKSEDLKNIILEERGLEFLGGFGHDKRPRSSYLDELWDHLNEHDRDEVFYRLREVCDELITLTDEKKRYYSSALSYINNVFKKDINYRKHDKELRLYLKSLLINAAKVDGSSISGIPELFEILHQETQAQDFIFELVMQSIDPELYIVGSEDTKVGKLYEFFKYFTTEQQLAVVERVHSICKGNNTSGRQLRSFIEYFQLKNDNKSISEVIKIALRHGVDSEVFLRSRKNIDAIDKLNPRETLALEFLTISKGTHIFTEGYRRLALGMVKKNYDEDVPILEIYRDFLKMKYEDPRFKPVLQKFAKDVGELEKLRESEFTNIENFAHFFAMLLSQELEEDYTNPVDIFRQFAIKQIGIDIAQDELFGFLKKRKDKSKIYTLAHELFKLNSDIAFLGNNCTSVVLETIKNKKPETLTNIIDNITNTLLLSDEPKRVLIFLAKLNEMSIEPSLDNVDRVCRLLVSREFNKAFRLQGKSDISDELKYIKERWGGNIKALFKAAGRYKASPDVERDLIPLLGEAIVAEMQGRFRGYKYTSKSEHGSSQSQLAHLDSEQKKKWIRNHSRITAFPSKSENEDEVARIKEEGKSIFLDQVNKQRHFTNALNSKKVVISQDFKKNINKFFKQDSIDLPNIMASIEGLSARDKAFHLFYILNKAVSSSKISEIDTINLAKSIRNDYHTYLADTDLINDLKEIINVLSKKPTKTSPSILFSTMSDSLRILLDIGDIVDSGSCQSLTSGSFTQTTLAPAIDAHTKVAISFNITEAMLGSSMDRWMTLINEGKVKTKFDHSSLTLKLENIDNPKEIRIVTFSNGSQRRIVRTGVDTVDYQASIGFERTYSSTKRSYEDEELDNLIESIGLKVSENMEVEQSKSPQGAYSDSGGGVQTFKYNMRTIIRKLSRVLAPNFSYKRSA